ncbi:hypothetical protein Anae109_3239 [Anaeromyxobacter sp. Fw109-5]|nr:hypothetical protein Anae109_3239 [Anaeromyxobacter sp. Fw109-5]
MLTVQRHARGAAVEGAAYAGRAGPSSSVPSTRRGAARRDHRARRMGPSRSRMAARPGPGGPSRAATVRERSNSTVAPRSLDAGGAPSRTTPSGGRARRRPRLVRPRAGAHLIGE